MNILDAYKKLITSLFFFPVIYLLGWLIISFFQLFLPSITIDKALFGTIITLIIFIFVLPLWSKSRWSIDKLWNSLGFDLTFLYNKKLSIKLLLEIFKAFLIIVFITSLLLLGNYATIKYEINSFVFLNSIFLGFIVALGEELAFRVWLFQELRLVFDKRASNLLQALIFALCHFRQDLSFLDNLQIIIGLCLLGTYLNKWREKKYRTLLFPIFFHSGIVGFWFLFTNSFIQIKGTIPNIFFGPGEGQYINPIGGLIAILILLILNFYRLPVLRTILSERGRTVRESFRDDLP